MFSEITLLLQFYIKESSLFEFGDVLYEFINNDTLNYRFHLALGGAVSYSTAAKSILSVYESVASYAPKGSKFQVRIISPPLSRDITPKTKTLLRNEVAAKLNKTSPASRKKERVTERQSNAYVKVTSIVDSSIMIDEDVEERGEVDLDLLKEDICETSKRQEYLVSYFGVVCAAFNRLCGKADSMYGSAGEKVKKHTVDPEVDFTRGNMKRTQGLHYMVKVLDSNGVFYRPSMIQFSRENLKKSSRSLNSIYETKDPKVPGMCELLVYWKVNRRHETVSTCSTQLSQFFIPCQSGKGDGSISIKSTIKGAVLYDFFIDKVCVNRITFRKHARLLIVYR